jgi:alpha-tubulin suppressor-like RCC1 family protein
LSPPGCRESRAWSSPSRPAHGTAARLRTPVRRTAGAATRMASWATAPGRRAQARPGSAAPASPRSSPAGIPAAASPPTAKPGAGAANLYGSVGDGATENRLEPVRVATAVRFKQLSSGLTNSCAVTTGGETLCWGRNDVGQIGDGTTDGPRLEPTPVQGGTRFSSVHAGGSLTCALTESGAAHCWGGGGELGDGTLAARPVPGPVAGSLSFRSLVVGWRHACGLTLDGATYCWGHNGSGQLGTGSHEAALVPTRVATTERFAGLSAGESHTCGVTPAGVVFCWGSNASGQLGGGMVSTGWLNPVPVRW